MHLTMKLRNNCFNSRCHQVHKKECRLLVKVYTDEGLSGTNTKHRAGFNEMIADALARKIDFIITKSISRFSRNTVGTLTNEKYKGSALLQKILHCRFFIEKAK